MKNTTDYKKNWFNKLRSIFQIDQLRKVYVYEAGKPVSKTFGYIGNTLVEETFTYAKKMKLEVTIFQDTVNDFHTTYIFITSPPQKTEFEKMVSEMHGRSKHNLQDLIDVVNNDDSRMDRLEKILNTTIMELKQTLQSHFK